MSEGPVDVVYTWVDDRFPGYLELLRRHAGATHDLNPNRTRDNLDLLKYSLRSLVNLSGIGHVYLVTCRPQIPSWLDAGVKGLSIVHHDAFMAAENLPTFNSFAILSSLHRIRGLSHRFLYVEDDMLFGAPASLSDFMDDAARLRLYPRLGYTRQARDRDRAGISPWNACLAHANHLLDVAFKPERRHGVNHVPLLIDRGWWQEMTERWRGDFARTGASRFRAAYNVVPEYLYPWFLHYTGRTVMGSLRDTYRASAYVPLENLPLTSWLALRRAGRARLVAMNDGFGSAPRAAVVRMARAFLEAQFPVKSRFER